MNQLMSPRQPIHELKDGIRSVKTVLLRCRAAGFSMNRCADFAEVPVTKVKYWLEHDPDFAAEWDSSINFLINSAMKKMMDLVFLGHSTVEIFEEDGEIKLIRKRNTDPTIRDMDVFLTRMERAMNTDKKEDRTEQVIEALRDVAASNRAKQNAD